MNKAWLVIATSALMAFATSFATPNASAHERCVCSMEVPPVPPIPPVPPVPPPPPRVHKQVLLINPDGEHGMRRVHRVVRIVERDGRHVVRVVDRDDDSRMTRQEFMNRAERAFREHDKNHDGVLDEDEREGMNDSDDEDNEEIDIPDAPEPPDADEAPEPPEAPAPPAPPRHHH